MERDDGEMEMEKGRGKDGYVEQEMEGERGRDG